MQILSYFEKANITFSEELVLDFLKDFNLDLNKSPYQIKKFADKTTKAFELITSVNYHKLSRENKEDIRPQYIEFAEKQKEIFSDDVWVNALFADYKCEEDKSKRKYEHIANYRNIIYSNWIITDVRFPNEAQAIKQKGGIVIRVNRGYALERLGNSKLPKLKHNSVTQHLSETSLDNYDFDYVIDNNKDIEHLIKEVKKLNII